ncbi:MAG: peptidase M64 [bacterium]|nr:peptidase M64 [bacterium]
MRRRLGWVLLFSLLTGVPAVAGFDDDFTGETLRVDYRHVGHATEEQIAVDRMRIEGPWPGSRTQLLDTTNLGKYLVEVVDAATNRMLYSRGFASIYGEWETTGEARAGTWRAIAEAVRVPEPKRPFQLRLRKRNADQTFGEIWATRIDPTSRFVDRAPLPRRDVWEFEVNGDPAVKVDLVILGDGYTGDEMDDFRTDVERAAQALFAEEPFASRRKDFNVRAIPTPASRSGISRPRAGVFRDTPLGARFNSFDSERYVLSLEDRRWRDVAAAAPYEFVLILVNERKYGGGGIYNLYSTAAAGSAFAPYLVVHEFGHHFAGLGDEYYTSPVSYEEFSGRNVEPWAPNITALNDPDNLKWGDLVERDTPLPTPWEKKKFEARSHEVQAHRRELRSAGAPEEQLEELFREERDEFTAMLRAEQHAGKVGAFEGAMYEATGLYRPTADCIMFTRDEVGFCPVCSRAIERVIDLYSH